MVDLESEAEAKRDGPAGAETGPAGPEAGPDDALDAAGAFRLGRLRDSRLRAANLRAIGGQCRNAYLGDSLSLCRVLGRFSLLVSTHDRTLAPHLLMRGIWEMHITECLARLVKPGMTVVDAGANYGYFAVLAGGFSGPDGRIVAIEANPAMADLLESNLELNGLRDRSRVCRVALGEGVGAEGLPFLIDPHRPMNARLLREGEDRRALSLAAGTAVVETPVRRLDELIAPGERVDVMKVDIEGAEQAFWGGAKRVLSENADVQILLEVRASRYRDAAGFFARIEADGFVLRVIRKTGVIEDISVDALVRSRSPGHDMLYLSRRASLARPFAAGRGASG